MSKPRTYTVRGFDVKAGAFNCRGFGSDIDTFTEASAPTEARAVELMLTDPRFSTMTELPPTVTDGRIDVVNVKIGVNVATASEARKARKQVTEVVKLWAEKSRVKGCRGWRASAIKTPVIKKAKTGGAPYELDFDVILGHAVFYSDSSFIVGKVHDQQFTADTLTDLTGQLQRQHPGLIDRLSWKNEAQATGGQL